MLLHNLLLLMISSKMFYQAHSISIAFVVDNTSSMKSKIDKVKDTVTQIIDTHSDFIFIDKYILVKFNEKEYLTKSKVYDDRYLFDVGLNLLNGTEVNLDCPEPALFGVMQALKRINDLNSNVYVFTDAPAKDFYKQRNVIELCQRTKSRITFVVMGQCIKDPNEYWMYKSIVKNCSGDVLIISGDELDQVPAYIRETIKGSPKVLLKTEVPANQAIDVKFTITNKTDYLIISASGRNVRISSHAWSQAKVIWTDNFKVIKILYPGFGDHTVLVNGVRTNITVNILAVSSDYSRPDENTSKTTDEVTDFTTTRLTEATSIKPRKLTLVESTESKSIPQAFISPVVAIAEGYRVEVPLGGTTLLTCKVTANPTPEIIWTDDNGNIMPSITTTLYAPYLIHISFVNITYVNDKHFYGCQASNILGNDTRYIEVALKDSPVFIFDNGEGEYPEIEERLLNNNTAYKSNEVIVDTPLTSTNISDGSEIVFKEKNVEKTVNWCMTDKLYCWEEFKLYEKYEWLFNGNAINETEETLDINNTGNFTCRAKNTEEFLQVNFTVVATTCCIINIAKKINHHTPFITSEKFTFPETIGLGNILMIPQDEKLTLVCHNPYPKTSPFYRNHVTVACDHENIFKVDDFSYTLEEIACDNEVYPIINSVDLKDKNKSLKEVGFVSEGKFINIYSIYLATSRKYSEMSIVAQYNQVNTNKNNSNELHWYDHPQVDKGSIPGVYTCHNDSSMCCYSKRQLVSANDVAYGAAQTSTFINQLNSVPFWRMCSNTSSEAALDYFEQTIRNIYKINITIWSGATNYIVHEGEEYVPTYLWKVIKTNDSKYFSYVYINVEDSGLYEVPCTNYQYSNLIPEGLKYRLYTCHMTELSRITGLPMSTFGL